MNVSCHWNVCNPLKWQASRKIEKIGLGAWHCPNAWAAVHQVNLALALSQQQLQVLGLNSHENTWIFHERMTVREADSTAIKLLAKRPCHLQKNLNSSQLFPTISVY